MKIFKEGISSSTLHILAMSLMLCDHLWATLFPWMEWLTSLGRIAFPIFAFMTAEGFYRTHDVKAYLKRLFIFALISEIPFNLIFGGSIFYPLHQNVLFTFILALILIMIIEKAKKKENALLTVIVSLICAGAGLLLGTITFVDYFGFGVLTVLVFYFFHERNWQCFLAQFICLYLINVKYLGGYYYPLELFGHEFEIVQQGFALFALIPIWLYKGKKGYNEKWFKYFCYAFYPAHLLILFLVWSAVS